MKNSCLKNPLISFIIPLYNSENTLANTLESVINQSSSNWEAILIDDGSSDNTRAIAESYSMLYESVQVFHQENAGVSAARNAAMKCARGEYVAFLDSDDSIHSDYVYNIENLLCDSRPDAVALAYRTRPQGKYFSFGQSCGNGLRFLIQSLKTKAAAFPCWLFLFSRTFIEGSGIEFFVGRRTGEDQEFVLKNLIIASSCLSIDDGNAYYIYNINNGSSAMSRNRKGQFDFPEAIESVIDYLELKQAYIAKEDYIELRGLLINRYIEACRYAAQMASLNGADKTEVGAWLAAAMKKLGDFPSAPLSIRNGLFVFIWRRCRRLIPLLYKPHN